MVLKSLTTLMFASVLGLTSYAQADFPEKEVSIVIPYGPGGGFDLAVRSFAPFFAKQFGEDTVVLPVNKPGAGGRLGTATLYRAKPDGYTLAIINLPGFALPEILNEKVDYDLRKMSWIGRLESQNYFLLVSAKSDIYTLEDLQNQDKITFLSTGYGSTVLAAAQIAAASLGLNEKSPVYITGYESTSNALVGLVRGDGNVAVSPVSSSSKYIESGDLRAIAVSGDEAVDDVQTFAQLGYPNLTQLNLDRAIAGPPGMAPELLAKLRKAFDAAVQDPEFLAQAKKARMDVLPLNGEQAQESLEDSYRFYEQFSTSLSNPNAN